LQTIQLDKIRQLLLILLQQLLRRHYVNAVKGIYFVRNETASRVLRYARFIQRASATIEAG